MSDEPKYWFPAKRRGFGWGIPSTWQGWGVMLAYVAAIIAVQYFLPPARGMERFLGGVALCTALLLLVCRLKGEPLRWRWGED